MDVARLHTDKQQCEAAIQAELVKFAEKYPQLHVTLLHQWQDWPIEAHGLDCLYGIGQSATCTCGTVNRKQVGHQVRLEVRL